MENIERESQKKPPPESPLFIVFPTTVSAHLFKLSAWIILATRFNFSCFGIDLGRRSIPENASVSLTVRLSKTMSSYFIFQEVIYNDSIVSRFRARYKIKKSSISNPRFQKFVTLFITCLRYISKVSIWCFCFRLTIQ